jgi:FKBP-type peptidyl-prolyl cis-trans isomerase
VRNRTWLAALALALAAAGAACSTDSTGVENTPPPALSGDTVTTSTGLKYIEAQVGTGATAHMGGTAAVHYSLWLLDGTFIETSRNGNPYTFTLGAGTIAGFSQGVAGMKVGGKRRLIIPPSLGYGSTAAGRIPANSTLIFDIELRAAAN